MRRFPGFGSLRQRFKVCLPVVPKSEILTGFSDCTLRISCRKTGTIRHVLAGHKSRIWDCAASSSSSLIASASGDGMVRIWSAVDGVCQAFLEGQGGDVYGVRWRPGPEVRSGGNAHDRLIVFHRIKLSLLRTIRSSVCGTLRKESRSIRFQGILRAL